MILGGENGKMARKCLIKHTVWCFLKTFWFIFHTLRKIHLCTKFGHCSSIPSWIFRGGYGHYAFLWRTKFVISVIWRHGSWIKMHIIYTFTGIVVPKNKIVFNNGPKGVIQGGATDTTHFTRTDLLFSLALHLRLPNTISLQYVLYTCWIITT